MDEIITQHAIFKILDNNIIPCCCGACRKILQNKESGLLITQCPKCKVEETFDISDLAIIGGALLLYAMGKNEKSEFKAPKVNK